MNITSLLITLAGIIFIVALYIISRVSQSKLPQNQSSRLPVLEDDNGNRFSSVLDDIPASDGSTPPPVKSHYEKQEEEATKSIPVHSTQEKTESTKVDEEDNTESLDDADDAKNTENDAIEKVEQQQHILFISGKDDSGLDGKAVLKALKKNGLVLADMDIYHYFPVMKDSYPEAEKYSLFRIANGVAPWTLKQEDLIGKKIAGLSIVMITPTKINDSEAISLFISLSEKICRQINGDLKNQHQQLFTAKEKKNLLYSFKN